MTNNVVQFSDYQQGDVTVADKESEEVIPEEVLYEVSRTEPEQVMVMAWYGDLDGPRYYSSTNDSCKVADGINSFMEKYYAGDLERYKFEPTEIELEAASKAIKDMFMLQFNAVLFTEDADKLAEVALTAAAKARNGDGE